MTALEIFGALLIGLAMPISVALIVRRPRTSNGDGKRLGNMPIGSLSVDDFKLIMHESVTKPIIDALHIHRRR